MKTSPLLILLSVTLIGGMMAGCAANKSVLQSAPAVQGRPIILQTATVTGDDPRAAGRAAAQALAQAMNGVKPHAVVMVDSFEDGTRKKQALQGVASVIPKDRIFGGATYGMFTQNGSHDIDTVALLGIGGEGLSITAALSENMGAAGLSLEDEGEKARLAKALQEAGARLALSLPEIETGTLLLLMADAHSPKNQFLIDGVQSVVGKELPITGGSVNKNAGQTFVYYRGNLYQDAAFGLLLSGDFKVAQTGHQAQSNDNVIATARLGSADALKKLQVKPFAVLAFNCAGRMGKLNRLEDELEAIQSSIGRELPLFGCYCAGEFGPAADAEPDDDTSTGRGWHVMFSVLGR